MRMTMTNFSVEIPSLIITVWMVLLVSSSLGTRAQERLQSKYHRKRHLLQLGNMMMCATGRVPSDYLDYGCFCGPGGDMKYAAMDDTDQCCRDHDKCYDDLTRRCPGYLFGLIPFPYLAIYSYQYHACLSVLSTSWTKVSPDVSRAPRGAANVIIQCNKKQSGDKVSAGCRGLLCSCDRNFSLCLGRSHYDDRHYSVNVQEKCKTTAP
ncbi:basic phospholipase A2 PA-11-like [Branchiostoma floridae]|uniref:Phospholipase A2 n=1 Tax=Branchiostoma floridae TaxID=7739 RepID=A0A9J7M7Q6_BRAFL|nr:basic phospholipase A2 PA-11-like [Branchiostoma floridae]